MFQDKIETERLILRKPRLEDAIIIFNKWTQDPDVTKYLVWKPHQNVETTRNHIQHCLDEWQTKKHFIYMICLKESEEIMGMIDARIEDYKVIFGYVLAKTHWNKGYMSEALKRLADEALDIDGIYRAWAFCDVENKGSARVMEKAGMKFEGILRRWSIHPNISNEPRDSLVYSKVK